MAAQMAEGNRAPITGIQKMTDEFKQLLVDGLAAAGLLAALLSGHTNQAAPDTSTNDQQPSAPGSKWQVVAYRRGTGLACALS